MQMVPSNVLRTLSRPEIVPAPHQVESHRFLLSCKQAYNLSEMGTGKTLPSVLAARDLFNGKAVKRVLVVAPLSVLGVWDAHLDQFAPEVPRMLLDRAHNRERRVVNAGEGIAIINPDGVSSVFRAIHEWRPELIIIDELAGYYRNARTRRWQTMAGVIHNCGVPVWGLTGTPMPKMLTDVYAQILMVTPKQMPRTRRGEVIRFVQFREMFMRERFPGMWVPRPGALEQVRDMMQPAIRFTRAQVMKDLPATIRNRVQVELTPEQKKLIEDLKQAGRVRYGDNVIRGAEASAFLTKLVQIACGAVYGDGQKVSHVPAEARVKAVVEVFEEAQSPIILAVPFIHVAHMLQTMFERRGLRCKCILGETKPGDRTEIVKQFQAGEIDVLLCHPKTAAHGLTLTRSHTVVWYAPLYDLELYEQLNDRIARFGQTSRPLVVEIYATPAELKIYECVRSKRTLQGKFLELVEGD